MRNERFDPKSRTRTSRTAAPHLPWWSIAGVVVAAACGDQAVDEDSSHGSANALAPIVLKPDADAYVRSGSYASTNFGSATTVGVDTNASGTVKQGYVRFSVGAVGPIAKATLRLHVTNGSTNSADVSKISSARWGESTIN